MTSRFASNLTVLLAGAFLACASFAFRASVVAWLAFGVGCAVLLTVLCVFPVRGRGTPQRVFDGCIFVIAAWTIVASRCFAGSTERWLSFASAATLALFAFVGLIVHEVLVELALARRVADRGNGRVPDARERPSLGALR
ncbi:MAG: hypothetical protein JWN10_2230 [Solirubrobacterales bacterium]|nr:hypothetical protein [Solirubrobacterales bacterium]